MRCAHHPCDGIVSMLVSSLRAWPVAAPPTTRRGRNMIRKQRSAIRLLAAVLAVAAWGMLPATAQAKTIKVAPTGSTKAIQDAVNAAAPGDTIVVAPGTYSGPTISVQTSDLTITGSKAAIIDATGHPDGITVGTTLTF